VPTIGYTSAADECMSGLYVSVVYSRLRIRCDTVGDVQVQSEINNVDTKVTSILEDGNLYHLAVAVRCRK
jgi:hypothetical protein